MHRAEPRPPPAASRATRLLLLSLLIVAAIPSAAQSRRQDDLTVSPATATLAVGNTVQLTVMNVGGAVTWSSDDTTVATVSAGGLVTARGVGDGRARIYAKYKSQRGWCDVTVAASAPPPPANQAPTAVISAPSGAVTIVEGESVSFGGSGTDPDGSVVQYAWSFLGGVPGSATVAAPGLVNYPTPGVFTATLTVTDEDGAESPAATRDVTVTAAPVIIPPPTEEAPAPPTSVAFVGSGSGSMVDNPTAVQFVPSSDHSTLEGYDRRTVHVASGSISEVFDVGVPTPSGGVCTVPISTANWTVDATYRVEVRSARSALTSSWIPSAQTGRRTSTPPPVDAADYYVATTGNDGNSGAIDSPFRTVAKGLSMLTAGDTLDIRAGTYAERITRSTPMIGTATAPITIRGHVGETVTIRPTTAPIVSLGGTFRYLIFDNLIIDGAVTQTAETAYAVTMFSASQSLASGAGWNTFQNMEIKNSAADAFYISPYDNGHNVFRNLIIHDGGRQAISDGTISHGYHGYYLQSSNNLFENVEIYNMRGHGMQIFSEFSFASLSNNVIRGCTFHDGIPYGNGSRGAAITIYNGANNTQIYNSLFYVGPWGLLLQNAANTQIYNNTVFGYSFDGIYISSSSSATVRNNIAYGNGTGGGVNLHNLAGANATLSNNLCNSGCNINANPLFVNSAGRNFHLQVGSPAINAGVAIGLVTVDHDGVTRGTPPDIGAYEYVP